MTACVIFCVGLVKLFNACSTCSVRQLFRCYTSTESHNLFHFQGMKIFFFVVGGIYLLYLGFLLVRACTELHSNPYNNLRLKFLTFLTSCVIIVRWANVWRSPSQSEQISCLFFGKSQCLCEIKYFSGVWRSVNIGNAVTYFMFFFGLWQSSFSVSKLHYSFVIWLTAISDKMKHEMCLLPILLWLTLLRKERCCE